MAAGASMSAGGVPWGGASSDAPSALQVLEQAVDAIEHGDPIGPRVLVGYRASESLEFIDPPAGPTPGQQHRHGDGGIVGHRRKGTAA